MDTSRVGNYKMVYSSIASEKNISIGLTLHYKGYTLRSTDTTNRNVLYSISENVSPFKPGNVKVSNTVLYQNETVNSSRPYIEVHNDTISGGFYSCSTLKLNGSRNYFSGDTLILNYYVQNKYSLICKYKR